jgi:hypothetical protein
MVGSHRPASVSSSAFVPRRCAIRRSCSGLNKHNCSEPPHRTILFGSLFRMVQRTSAMGSRLPVAASSRGG